MVFSNEDIVNTKGKIHKLPEKYRHNKLIIIIVTTQAHVILYVQNQSLTVDAFSHNRDNDTFNSFRLFYFVSLHAEKMIELTIFEDMYQKDNTASILMFQK